MGALALPSALAQAKVWRIGVVGGIVRPASLEDSIYGGLVQGLRELGYVEGRNLFIEWRFADNKFERFPEFARELVALKVDLIVSGNTPATHALQKATKTIPIVMGASGDPVAAGLVQSLARPGGNTTGLSQNLSDLAPKSLELLKTILPKLSRVAVLRGSRCAAQLQPVDPRAFPALCGLRRQDFQRRETGRSPGRAAQRLRALRRARFAARTGSMGCAISCRVICRFVSALSQSRDIRIRPL